MMGFIVFALFVIVIYLVISKKKNEKGVKVEVKMVNPEKGTLSKEQAIELDSILTEFYKAVSDELVANKQYTNEKIEKMAMQWINYLFDTIKSFEILTEKSEVFKHLEIRVENNIKFDKENEKKIYDILIKYYVFVAKCLKPNDSFTKDKVCNLSEAWLKDYLRIESYKSDFNKCVLS